MLGRCLMERSTGMDATRKKMELSIRGHLSMMRGMARGNISGMTGESTKEYTQTTKDKTWVSTPGQVETCTREN